MRLGALSKLELGVVGRHLPAGRGRAAEQQSGTRVQKSMCVQVLLGWYYRGFSV
jgi:hypothetical protein